MKLDLTPVYVAIGIGLATYIVLRLKKVKSPVKFNEILYDKKKNEIRLLIENVTGKPVYVRPALRLVKLTPVSEWKEKTANGNGIPMMSAAAGSVIKGYELIGEYAEPVLVQPSCTTSVTYPVMRDFGLKAYDNIKVDASFGASPSELSGNTTATVRMNLRELMSEEYAQELLDALEEYMHEVSMEYAPEGSFKQLISLEPKAEPNPAPVEAAPAGKEAPAECVTQESPGFKRSEYPLESMCVCCGKVRWLNWVVNENHVCDECKDYLVPHQPAVEESGNREVGDMEDVGGEYPEVEMVYSEPVELKPRHEKILDILNKENTITAREIAKRLNRKEKNISSDLRYLMTSGLIDRVKIGRVYKYFSLRDSEQVVLKEDAAEDSVVWT